MINNRLLLDEPITGKYILQLFAMNNNLYNLNSTNDKFYANSSIISLTNGNYIGLELATLLESALISEFSDATITVTYNTNAGKLTISSPSTSLALEFGSNISNSARKLFGFDQTDTTTSTTNISPNVAHLSPYSVIFLGIKEDNDDVIQGSNHFASTFVLFDKSSSFTGTLRMTSEDLFQTVKFSRTKSLRFEFSDVDDNEVEFNGAEFIILLKKLEHSSKHTY